MIKAEIEIHKNAFKLSNFLVEKLKLDINNRKIKEKNIHNKEINIPKFGAKLHFITLK
jgi:hypothetical protein